MEQALISDLCAKLSVCRRNDTVEIVHNSLAKWILRKHKNGESCKLYPVKHLAEKLHIARQTVLKAYLELEKEQLIYRQSSRVWLVEKKNISGVKKFALILPTGFSDYYQTGMEYGRRRFRTYSGMLDRAIELNIAIIPIVLPAPDAQEKEIENSLLELNKNYCGIIHLGDRGYTHDPVLERVLELRHMPQIAISCEFSQPWIGAVTFDPNHLAQVVVSHFRECGHRNICLVYPHESSSKNLGCKYMMTSKNSVHQPFQNTHIKFDNICEIRVRSRSYDQKFKDDVEEIINRDKQPTAFWCRDDLTAITLINELKLHGYSVPDDFSVMGFDNLIEAAEAEPPLTTLSNPLYELGYAAISKLDDYINSGINEKNRITRLSPVLSIRQSTGIINNKKRI